MTLNEFKAYALAKKQIEYHSFSSGALYQCVDLANDYITKVWGLEAIIGVHAKGFPEYLKPGMEFVENTPEYLPEPGEVVVWNEKVGGGYGHIAVVTEKGKQLTFRSLDQNWSKPLYITEETHSYNNVRGFIRKKGGTMDYEKLYNEARVQRDQWWSNMSKLIKATELDFNEGNANGQTDEAVKRIQAWKSASERLSQEVKDKEAVISKQMGELFDLTQKYNQEVTAHKATKTALVACQSNQPETEWEPNGKTVATTVGNTVTTINYRRGNE